MMSALEWIAIWIALVLVLGGGAWFWVRRTHERPPDPPLNGPPAAGGT